MSCRGIEAPCLCSLSSFLEATQWTAQKFNPSEARQIQQSGHADLSSSPPAKKKSTPIGVIAGGVVGGLVVLAVFIGLAFWIKRRYRTPTEPLFLDGQDAHATHVRQVSDSTFTSRMTTSGGSTFTSVLPSMFRSQAARMHNTSVSVSSLPFFSSVIASELHQSSSASPRQTNGSAPVRPENVVTPFTLPPTIDSPDKKQSNGEWPVFNSADTSPNLVRMEVIPSVNNTRRERYNPPAYTESDLGSTRPSLHRIQESVDSTSYSVAGSTIYGDTSLQRTHTPVNSVSSMGHTVVVSSPVNTSFRTSSSSHDYGNLISERSWNSRRQESFHASDIA